MCLSSFRYDDKLHPKLQRTFHSDLRWLFIDIRGTKFNFAVTSCWHHPKLLSYGTSLPRSALLLCCAHRADSCPISDPSFWLTLLKGPSKMSSIYKIRFYQNLKSLKSRNWSSRFEWSLDHKFLTLTSQILPPPLLKMCLSSALDVNMSWSFFLLCSIYIPKSVYI